MDIEYRLKKAFETPNGIKKKKNVFSNSFKSIELKIRC